MPSRHAFDPSILRQYDIRGIVGETLHEADARALGRAFATLVRRAGGHDVCVGYDGRTSSPALAAALIEGLRASGVDARRIGLGPSPMLYFATHTLGAGGGVMVTGSHNPPDHNGFKLMLGRRTLYGDDIQALGTLSAQGDVESGAGGLEETAIAPAYVEALAGAYDGRRDLAAAWDPGNGACGAVLGDLLARLPGRHVAINEAVDGSFPAHHPDPTVPENLVQLRRAVVEQDCDVGFAFDGDGDRIGVLDGRGRILWGDQILALLAREVLSERPGATVIGDVKASQMLFDEIARLGGRPLMWRTGHSLIKSKMAELGAPLAGEMSGHIFFADRWYGFDDGLYVAVRFLGLAANSDRTVAELLDELPLAVNTPELRFPCPEARKFAVVEEVHARLAADGVEVNDIDGVRVTSPEGWWLLRASNTQAVLVARCEAKDAEALAKLKATLEDQLRRSGVETADL